MPDDVEIHIDLGGETQRVGTFYAPRRGPRAPVTFEYHDSQPCEGTAPNDRAAALTAILLSRFAIDQRYQRLGHARSLMRFVLMSAESVSKNIRCFCILTHPLDDQVRAFFSTFGFEDIPGDPAGGMAIRLIDLENRISE